MFFKRSLVSAIILFSCFANAQVYVWPLILKARGERTEEQSIQLRSNELPSFGASYKFDRWIVSLDTSRFSVDSDNGNVNIETKYTDVAIWGGYSLFQGEIWDFYAVAGTGVYQQKIETSISGVSTTNRTHDRSLVGAGAEYLVVTPFSFAVAAGGRFNWTQDLEPEIMPEIYIKLGAYF